ncbi:MAG: hypothetical protein R2747_19340 [Pyrinomonadaceae bacterium]
MTKNEVWKKTLRRTILPVILVLGCFLTDSAAQTDQSFERGDLRTLTRAAYEKLNDLAYRSVRVEENFDGEGGAEKTISEFVPPDRRHTIIEKKTEKGVKTDEYIYVDGIGYHRTDDEDWQIIRGGSGSGSGNGSGIGETPIITEERRLVRGQIVGKQKADLYEIVTTHKFTDHSNIYESRVWLNEAGLFVKTESKTSYGISKKTYRTTVDYEYDPKIKIEAPEIKKQ